MNASDPLNLLITILVEKSMNQSALNSNIESTLARAKLLTNLSNNGLNNTISSRNVH